MPDFEATQRLCEQLHVPQVAIRVSGLSSFNNPCNNEYVLRMTPSDSPQLIGIVAFIKYFGWKRVAVIASSDKSGQEFKSEGLAEPAWLHDCFYSPYETSKKRKKKKTRWLSLWTSSSRER